MSADTLDRTPATAVPPDAGPRLPLRSWLVALRIARREARRAKGRTALIVAMIGLPVMGLVFAATVFDMQRLTPQENATRALGSAVAAAYLDGSGDSGPETAYAAAQLSLNGDGSTHPPAAILPYLPAGATTTAIWQDTIGVRTPAGVTGITSFGVDGASPLTQGYLHFFDGRAPRAGNEVAASPSALTRLGTHLGGTISTITGARYTVVGVAEAGGAIEDSLVFPPGNQPADAGGYWLIGQPGPMLIDEIHALNKHHIQVESREYFLHPLPLTPQEVANGLGTLSETSRFSLVTIVAGLGLLEVVLLAGPAFAVGARRRQRQLALVATNGGTPSVLRRIVLADGVVCGVLAAAAGGILGVAAAFVFRGTLEEHLFHARFGGYRTNALWLAGIAALSIVTGLLGALVPAFTAARLEIVAALAGRRGIQRGRMRWLAVGIALLLLGGAITAYGTYGLRQEILVIGLAVAEFGLVLCTPSLVGWIAKVGRFLPLTPRIALRDASRRRASAAPAISAVMAAVAGSIALTMYMGAQNTQRPVYYGAAPLGTVFVNVATTDTHNADLTRPVADVLRDQAKVRAALTAQFPGARMAGFDTMVCTSTSLCGIAAATPPDRVCPYEGKPNLSRADQRRARADARCGLNPANTAIGAQGGLVTDDPTVVSLLTGLSGTELTQAVTTLRAGGVLLSNPAFVEAGRAYIEVNASDGSDATIKGVTAMVVPAGGASYEPIAGPALVRQLGLAHTKIIIEPGGIVAAPATRPTSADVDHLSSALYGLDAPIYVERGDHPPSNPLPLLLAIAAGVVALGAAGISTGLAAADSRNDLATLGAVGATPRMRRALSLAQAGIISGLGALLGAVAGFGAAAAILTAINRVWASTWPGPDQLTITVPWINFGISLVAVPVVAMLAAGLLTRSRLPSERRAD